MARTLRTFTFQYKTGTIEYNRLDGYTAWLNGARLGGTETRAAAEHLIDMAGAKA